MSNHAHASEASISASSPPNHSARAPNAADPSRSRGRLVPEPDAWPRSPWQRDRDRIVHATAFRRLEAKTQVFAAIDGDHFRTRLTHTLEVSQIGRTIARVLRVDEDLTEAISLAHDLGHSPFGHAGEEALNACLRDVGGFDHNVQTFRILTRLERRYAAFDGLNLTAETLEGVVKHNGPLEGPVPAAIADWNARQDLRLQLQPSVEAQIAALADDIAYCSHDVDDGLRAGFFQAQDLRCLPLAAAVLDEVEQHDGGLERSRLAGEIQRRLIDRMVRDLLAETTGRLKELAPGSADDVMQLPTACVAFSPAMHRSVAELRAFLRERVWHHYTVNRMTRRAKQILRALFESFFEAPECLPEEWRTRAGAAGSRACAEVVRDYVAGMTDRFALDEHDRLFRIARTRP
ncbi:MAG TPA: deoxyguanosinetriphosphate triphosphohydrolase [Geminicoccus sp.]|uniref:deoxyguanosinetriphosphate triphosphohydrolase n=1 Tax=Geminicoccus sp. TaxID=2024832 RepID=UPI002E317B7F|nr:deoxyguanosinetriphosphate triphosphohydrolase [Geminicoccus sp.]HEX2529169.1 deoxyguanosinetriphosphate triphosphohydrolase [Geminicoccus sp.]